MRFSNSVFYYVTIGAVSSTVAAAFVSYPVATERFATNVITVARPWSALENKPIYSKHYHTPNPVSLQSSRNPNEFNWDKNGGMLEIAAGAVLGGLVLGPFGALYGASVGAKLGQRHSVDQAQREELAQLGITPEMMKMANDVGQALERTVEGLQAARDSLETQQRLARRLDDEIRELFEQARTALARSDEDTARRKLGQRHFASERLKTVLKQCAEEKRRVEIMEDNVRALELRASDIDALLRRTVGAKKRQAANEYRVDTTMRQPRLMGGTMAEANEFGRTLADRSDPLLQKFRDSGIDF